MQLGPGGENTKDEVGEVGQKSAGYLNNGNAYNSFGNSIQRITPVIYL